IFRTTRPVPLPDEATEATFRGLLELYEEHGIRLLLDEVYRGLELDARCRLPQAADLSTTAVSLNVDVEGGWAARAADRLAFLSRPDATRPVRASHALHEHLQRWSR